MDKKVIVFDFDKTLTYSDTLLGFYLSAGKRNIIFLINCGLYIFAMVLSKLKVISNDNLKRIGISLFLKNISSFGIEEISIKYSNQIKFNKLYNSFNFKSKHLIFIVSASYINYLTPIFPENVHVIGSEFLFKGDKIVGLKYNCYQEKKKEALSRIGIYSIDELYTDSYSDLSMAKIASKITIVKKDTYIQCENIQNFINYFKN